MKGLPLLYITTKQKQKKPQKQKRKQKWKPTSKQTSKTHPRWCYKVSMPKGYKENGKQDPPSEIDFKGMSMSQS